MIEALVAGGALMFLLTAVNWKRVDLPVRPSGSGFGREPRFRFDTETTPDLPCPWCHAATSEDDDRCPSCGQRFG